MHYTRSFLIVKLEIVGYNADSLIFKDLELVAQLVRALR